MGKRIKCFALQPPSASFFVRCSHRQVMCLRGWLLKLDLLVVDEPGYVPASKVGAALLFDVISAAHERTSIIVITNLPFENLTEVLGSKRLNGTVLGRLTHRGHIIALTATEKHSTGGSWELRFCRALFLFRYFMLFLKSTIT
jgi:hypothetical protein